MKQIDILWLIEHVAREMDVACAVSAILKKKLGLNIEIKHIHLERHIGQYEPKLIIYPFFYGLNTGSGKFFIRWPEKKHLNLNWEQIFYSGVAKLKKPKDEYAKKYIFQSVWGSFYKKYLIENGVAKNNIIVNGNPAYQLYLPPYCNYYQNRNQLASKYNLDTKKRWIFIPENYRWAFNSDQEIKSKQKMGGDFSEMQKMKEYCIESLKRLLSWCNETAKKNKNVIILFRPKPITALSLMIKFFKKEISETIPSNLIIFKNESVREWIIASDATISNFSTTLIEASVANKHIAIVEPVTMPDILKNDWYGLIPLIKTREAFENACNDANGTCIAEELHQWAALEMLEYGDSIQNLARTITDILEDKILIEINYQKNTTLTSEKNLAKKSDSFISQTFKNILNLISGKTEKDFHENDLFTSLDVENKIINWNKVL